MSSPYVRLKLLLAPASASAGSASSPRAAPASVSYVVKKLEVPRSLPFARLLAKLGKLYGLGASFGCTLQVAMDAKELDDSAVDRSDKVAALLWEEIQAEDDATWNAALNGREKLLVRLTPRAGGDVSAVAPLKIDAQAGSSSAGAHRCKFVQPVVPPKSALPWPRYSPAPGSLPLIVLSNEEHEWELLDEEGEGERAPGSEDEWETDEKQSVAAVGAGAAGKKPLVSCSGAAGKLAQAAAVNPKVSISELVAKPHRVLPPELAARLTGGALASNGEGAAAVVKKAGDASPVSVAPPAPSTAAVTFAVNGSTVTVPNPAPDVKLIEYLRYQAGVTGSKIGCGEGGCGACTVVLSRTDAVSGQITQVSTNACLHPLAAMDGWAVTTTEGLGSVQSGLHPIQKALVDNWGTQCGYCTPGFTMSMYGLLVNEPKPTAQQIEDRFDSNICRCTGYRPIFKAMRAVVPGLAQEELRKAKEAGGCGGKCKCGSGGCGGAVAKAGDVESDAKASTCGGSPAASSACGSQLTPCGKGEGTGCSSDAKSACHAVGIGCGFKQQKKPGVNSNALLDMEDLVTYDPANPKHNINPFPSDLLERAHATARAKQSGVALPLRWSASAAHLWIEPQTIQDIYAILAYYRPQGEVVKLLVGNTSIGVEKFYPFNATADQPTVFVPIGDVAQLKNVAVQPDALYVGAAITLSSLIALLESTVATVPAASVTSWLPLIRHLKMVANTGVRNVASWAGNLLIAKNHPEFPSDLMTIFAGVGATLQLISGTAGLRNVAVADFHTTKMYVDELVQTLRIPFTPTGFVFDTYKVRARHQNAHPIINAAYGLQLQSTKGPNGMPIIQSASLIVGGLSQQGIFRCTATQNALVGQELVPATMAAALAALDKEAVAVGRLVAGSTYFIADDACRHSLVLTTFYKFFLQAYAGAGGAVPARDASAFAVYERPVSSGSEIFVPDPAETKPLGQAVPKLESAIQASGEAEYIDDAPMAPNGLYGAYFYSTVGSATIAKIDASAALALPGVVRVITAADIASVNGANDCGSFPGDEEVFASTNVTATGQAIGLVLADSRLHAEQGAAAVNVSYTNVLASPLVTIADAIKAGSFFPDNQYMQNPPPIACGDFAGAFKTAPLKLTGNNFTGGQAHFSMETQTCTATPRENDALFIQSSSQGPTDIRGMVTRVTGLPANKVVVSSKRVGGGFGGKLSRSHPIASAAALAARITKRPVKIQCSRDTEMDMWGKRSHMYMEYQIGFNAQGKVLALNVTFYQLGGHTYDSNFGAMSMCLLWADSAYFIPNYSVQGKTCRTNTPSNTAMRGPGAMKSIWHMEMIMELVANATGLAPNAVREANFYTEGQATPYGMPVVNITMQKMWAQLQTQANFAATQQSVAAFNAANKWRKRGVHMSALKYGISTPGNQVGILLNVMEDDGTVLVSCTAVELGQGVNTKVAQVIAAQLGIDIGLITFDDNATNIVCNGSQTGGSATSECASGAAVLACTDLNARLAPFKKDGQSWAATVAAAAAGLVNLTVSAQFNIPGPASGMPFTYFVWACAATQIELDVLTGEVQVLQADVVYDSGDSLNPAVDIGQIEGAFMLGLGHYLTEEVVHDTSNARLLTRGTWDYHPPSSQDIPLSLNVTLLAGAPNKAPLSVLGSKASAEPPMMLSCSLFLAVRDAIAAVRADAGATGWFELPTPASTTAIQIACGIKPAALVL